MFAPTKPPLPSATPARLALLGGLLAGVGLTALGLWRPQATPLPDGVAAMVGEVPISTASWQQAVAAVATERRTPLTAADKAAILQRLIDEQLLLQAGQRMSLLQDDRSLRAIWVQKVLERLGNTPPVSEADIARFYAQEQARYAPPPLLHVQALHAPLGVATAQQALWQAGDRAWLAPALPLPDGLVPVSTLHNYLPASVVALAQQSAARAAGGVLLPQDDGSAWLLRVLASQTQALPPLAEIADAVRGDAQRAAEEAAVAQALQALRREIGVRSP